MTIPFIEILDNRGHILKRPESKNMMGYSHSILMGRELDSFLMKNVNALFGKEVVWQGEFLCQNKTGSRVCQYLTIIPITSDGKQRFIKFSIDISKEKFNADGLIQVQELNEYFLISEAGTLIKANQKGIDFLKNKNETLANVTLDFISNELKTPFEAALKAIPSIINITINGSRYQCITMPMMIGTSKEKAVALSLVNESTITYTKDMYDLDMSNSSWLLTNNFLEDIMNYNGVNSSMGHFTWMLKTNYFAIHEKESSLIDINNLKPEKVIGALDILLIDDDPLQHFINTKLINAIDKVATLKSCMGGSEGLEYLENLEKMPDIILLDINMPGMNGWQFAEAITAKNYDLNIYVLTSSLDYEDLNKCDEFDSIKGFFNKPLNFKQIGKILRPKG